MHEMISWFGTVLGAIRVAVLLPAYAARQQHVLLMPDLLLETASLACMMVRVCASCAM